jgi:hypothetical protein
MLIFPALLLPMSGELDVSFAVEVNFSYLIYLLYGFIAAPWGFLSDHW